MGAIRAVLPRAVSQFTRARAEKVRHRPYNCVWELTLACNLRCAHCGSRAGRPRERELDTAECLDVVDQLAELGCDLVTLSGGEPLLRPDWDVVARAAADRGMFVNLVTNGTLLDRERARRAVDAGLCNVGVSIDGPEYLHDEVRGKGAFRRTLDGIEHLKAVGMSVSVLTHVNRLNLDLLEETWRIAVGAGAASWRVQLGKPMGSLKERGDLVIAPRDLLRLIPEVARLKALGRIRVGVGDSIGYFGPHDKALRGRGWRGGRPESWQGCQAGMQAIGIESDGGIKGCLSLQAKEEGDFDPFLEGSLREHSLAELWFREGAFAYNREFDQASLTGACRRCSKATVCRGGARCVAAAATGRLSEDPYCWQRVAMMESTPGLRATLMRGAVAASAALAVAIGGCGGDASEDTSAGGPDAAEVVQQDDGGTPGLDAYVPPEAKEETVGPDPGSADHPSPDPGTPDQAGVPEAVTPDQGPDAIDCSKVCCECEYGIIPDEVWEACCMPPSDPVPDAAPDPAPDAVQPPDVATPDAIDCENVCCLCDYGVIPDEVWKACCAQPEPAPEPAPDAVQPGEGVLPDALDCASVCCTCEYGVIPDEVWKQCCAICNDPKYSCCECDYGETPPPQCCP